MRFLLDANCWMQIIRKREQEAEVRLLLEEVPPAELWLTDFALHTLAILMQRHKVLHQFEAFIDGVGIDREIRVVRLATRDLARVVERCGRFSLDVDDSYPYVAAEQNNLDLVSLDTDFDRTPRGRLTRAAALQKFRDEQRNQQQDA